MLRTIYLKLLRWLQSKCEHPGNAIRADILEGDAEGLAIQWCEICGAWRRTASPLVFKKDFDSLPEFRQPRPDYYTPRQRKILRRAIARDAALDAERAAAYNKLALTIAGVGKGMNTFGDTLAKDLVQKRFIQSIDPRGCRQPGLDKGSGPIGDATKFTRPE